MKVSKLKRALALLTSVATATSALVIPVGAATAPTGSDDAAWIYGTTADARPSEARLTADLPGTDSLITDASGNTAYGDIVEVDIMLDNVVEGFKTCTFYVHFDYNTFIAASSSTNWAA